MVETTEQNTQQEVREVGADKGYSGYENYEYLSKTGKIGYIPDSNMSRESRRELSKYHQDNFTYDRERDEYLCPEGFRLSVYKVRRQNASYRRWPQVIYKGESCLHCEKRNLCTTQRYRTIARDDRKELLEETRKRLKTKEGHQRYMKRL